MKLHAVLLMVLPTRALKGATRALKGGVWNAYVNAWVEPLSLPACSAARNVDIVSFWSTGQVVSGPLAPKEQPAWLARLRKWRDGCRKSLKLDEAIYDEPALQWTQSAFVQAQAHTFDLGLYDPAAREYTVDDWLDGLSDRFGGIEAVLLWPTYTNVGIDERNSYDLARLLPGAAMKSGDAIVRQLHARGVRVLWPYMVWDTGTRDEGLPDELAMARLQRESGADGFNGDTLWHIDAAMYTASKAQGTPAAIQPEWGADLSTLNHSTMGWGEAGGWTSGFGGSSIGSQPPLVAVRTPGPVGPRESRGEPGLRRGSPSSG